MQLGWPEIIFIMIVLILIFGPSKLVEAGRELGKGFRHLNKEVGKLKTISTTENAEPLLKVFISSKMDEFAEERKAIADAIKAVPIIKPWLFEQSPPSSDSVEETYLEQVKSCDIFVLMIGSSIPNAVIKEYETAVHAQKPIIVLIKRGEKDAATSEFIRNTIGLKIKWNEFSTIDDLSGLIQVGLASEVIKGYRRYRLSKEQVATLIIFVNELGNRDFEPLFPPQICGIWKVKFLVENITLTKFDIWDAEAKFLLCDNGDLKLISGIERGVDVHANTEGIFGKWSAFDDFVKISWRNDDVNCGAILNGSEMTGYAYSKGHTGAIFNAKKIEVVNKTS